jgi:ectoine hydroxylase-related dioxygenase (phytanoyl-CoA dioxygenase family)
MFTGIVNGSGIPRGALHSDWPYNQKSAAHVPAPYPDAVMHIVTMWMLNDFTAENGGTIVVPRSHKQACHPIDEAAMRPWPGETQLTGKAGTVAAFDARLWHAVAGNRTNADRVAVLVRYAPWWLNLDTLRPGTADHRDIVELNEGKDSVVPPLSREQFERLPDAAQRLLRYSVSQ